MLLRRTPPAIAVLLLLSSASAAQPTSTELPLARLPSPPGPHLEKVKALGADSWLDLGAPTPDPVKGNALGRSYSPRMVYLPKQRAAFLIGQGPHGGMKKDGIYQDEAFAYDINAHKWTCIYPGSDVNKLTLKLDANGFEINDQGEHVPVAIMGHGHNLLTYDCDLNKVVLIPLGNTWWPDRFSRRKQWLDESANNWLRNPKYPWFYDLATGRWEHRFIEGDGPGPRQFLSVAEYLPSRKQTFYLYNGCKGWLYDYAANKWTATSNPTEPLKGYDWNGCLDTKRERVLVGAGKDLLAYEAKTGDWKKLASPPEPATFGNSSGWTVTYDAASDTLMLAVFALGDARKSPANGYLYFYDCASDKWNEKPVPIDNSINGSVNAFYDPELNAHFFHVAHDGRPNGKIFVFRHKIAAK